MDLRTGWHNMKTGEFDFLPQGAMLEFDDEQARQYISQSPAAQGYYSVSRKLGLSVVEALLNTLTVSVGESVEYEVPESDIAKAKRRNDMRGGALGVSLAISTIALIAFVYSGNAVLALIALVTLSIVTAAIVRLRTDDTAPPASATDGGTEKE